MSYFSRKKKHSHSNSSPANGLVSQFLQLQFPIESQSQSQSHSQSQQKQSQSVHPWSAHAPQSRSSPSPFPRDTHALSTIATAAGELFLFGGCVPSSNLSIASNDLYVISTRDFSTTLLKTSGDVPSPRYGHCAVLTSTVLLTWGGMMVRNGQYQDHDDSLYLLNLESRDWVRIVVNGPGPCGRYYHTMTLVGSKLFVFGGWSADRCLNDIWALDLNCLKSNPFWESYELAPGEKPFPRGGHVSVTTGDRIIIFGGYDGRLNFNDTWSFDISTRKWTELQCTGSIPSPRERHAAVLIDDVMYVFGGLRGTELGDLTTFNLPTQRWTAFQDIEPSPSGRYDHAMACDGRHVFVLGGQLSLGAQADLIHVLDTKLLIYPEPDSNTVRGKRSEKTTQLVGKSSASPPAQGQPHQPTSSLSDAHAAHGASPFQKATPEELDHPTSQQITREQNSNLNGLPSRRTGASGRPRRVPEEDDDGEGSTEHRAKVMAPDAPGKEIARLKDGHLIELELELSETPVAKSERDRRIARLTDELALKSALLEQGEANAAEEKKRAGRELRELQAKLDESLLSRDHALEQAEASAAEERKRAELELRELQAKFDELMLSRDHALEQAEANAAEEKKRTGLELRELQAKLDESLLSRDQAEASEAKAKERTGLELHELQAKLDELTLSRDEHLRTLEETQRTLQEASSRAADANERSQRAFEQIGEYETKLAEVRAELEETKSELGSVRLPLTDAKGGRAKSSANEEKLSAQNTAGPVNMDEDLVTRGILERMRAMEAEIASLRWGEKNFEMMECRNED